MCLCGIDTAGDLPEIVDGQGRPYVHGKCWEDIYDALSNAKHFIYLCGMQRRPGHTVVYFPLTPTDLLLPLSCLVAW
jgi:phospholipase D1/2